ncbi:SART-1 family DOT2 [Olea europaea subsp. europaea]|uniref:SART-1 family DOT2 n=1 Tax=Olea europaea subsp. europaea TaxID=158383 RepID=A0A8S0PIW1_OLEEU|nr:SART-1 family DOT2 [Olea europaea subsp. europaea]
MFICGVDVSAFGDDDEDFRLLSFICGAAFSAVATATPSVVILNQFLGILVLLIVDIIRPKLGFCHSFVALLLLLIKLLRERLSIVLLWQSDERRQELVLESHNSAIKLLEKPWCGQNSSWDRKSLEYGAIVFTIRVYLLMVISIKTKIFEGGITTYVPEMICSKMWKWESKSERMKLIRLQKKQTRIYDYKFVVELGAEKKIFPQYDNLIADEGITFDANGHFTDEARKELEEASYLC